MKKKNIRECVLLIIVFAAYNAVVFLVPFKKTGVFWLTYVFTLATFAVAAISLVIAFRRPDTKSRFYGFPIANIGVLYFLFQLVLGTVFIILGNFVPLWMAAVLYILALAITLVGLIGTDIVVEEIHMQDEKLKNDISVMRQLQSKMGQLVVQCSDKDMTTVVKNLADEMRYSDPVSSEGTTETEKELSSLVNELQRAVTDGDSESVSKLCHRALGILAERNRLCKLGKS